MASDIFNDDQRMFGIIREYRANLPSPESYWPILEFDKFAYSIWAVDELIAYVLSNTDKTVEQAVQEFHSLMLEYSCISTDFSDANFMFDIAVDVTDDIIEIFYAMS